MSRIRLRRVPRVSVVAPALMGLLSLLPGCGRDDAANVEPVDSVAAEPSEPQSSAATRAAQASASEERLIRAGRDGLRMIESAVHGNVDGVRLALTSGVPAEVVDRTDHTALHAAARNGHPEIAQMLIDHGAVVDRRASGGMTSLHLAARGGHLEVARILLEHGADVNARTDRGHTPLNFAVMNRFPDVADLLLAHGGTSRAAED